MRDLAWVVVVLGMMVVIGVVVRPASRVLMPGAELASVASTGKDAMFTMDAMKQVDPDLRRDIQTRCRLEAGGGVDDLSARGATSEEQLAFARRETACRRKALGLSTSRPWTGPEAVVAQAPATVTSRMTTDSVFSPRPQASSPPIALLAGLSCGAATLFLGLAGAVVATRLLSSPALEGDPALS